MSALCPQIVVLDKHEDFFKINVSKYRSILDYVNKKGGASKTGDVLLAFVMKKKLFYVKKVYFLLTLFIVNEVHDGIVVNI